MNVLKFAFAFMAIPLLANCGGVSHKISFNGTNCSLYDSSGKLIEGSVNVKDGTSVDYVFHVEDEEQFSVPNEVDIEGKIKEYTYDADTGALKISRINSDLVITANAVTNCDVTYPTDDPNQNWEGRTKTGLGKKFTAKAIIKEKYWIAPDNLKVYVAPNESALPADNYTFEDNVLTIEGKYVTGDIRIEASTSKIPNVIHFIGDEYCDVEPIAYFEDDDWDSFNVGCTFEELYTIGQVSVEPENALKVDFNDPSTLKVTPLANCSSMVTITSVKRENFTFDSSVESLSIQFITYSTDKVTVEVTVGDSYQGYYFIPPEASDFEISDESGNNIAFDFNRISDYLADLTIDRSLLISGASYTIHTFDYKVKFAVTNDLKDSLVSEDLLTVASRDENFVFNLKIDNSENAEADIIPYTLDITYSDGSKMPKEACDIEADANRQTASVTIYKEYINDDFTISGKPMQYNYFEYDMFGFGVNFQDPIEEGYISGFASKTATTEIELVGDNLNQLSEDRIIIEDENGNCYRLNDTDLPDKYKCISLVVEGSGAEEIVARLKIVNPTFDYIVVYFSMPGYEFFSKLSWNTIDMFSQKGWASTFFAVGQTKELVYGNITYDVRIIGFNHDDLASENGEKAGITLEFEQLITKQDGSLHKGRFSATPGDESYDYSKSDYRTYLEGSFLSNMPYEVTSHMKKVNKLYSVFKDDNLHTFSTHIFPLSLKELGLTQEFIKDEGSTYAYYNGADKSLRKKAAVNSTSFSTYWTRSIYYVNNPNYAISIDSNGDKVLYEKKDANRGYAAAFCI